MIKIIKGLAILTIALVINTNAEKLKYPKVENLNSIQFMSAQEVKDLYTNNTLYGKNLKFKKNMEISFSDDGTYKGTVAGGKKKVSGTWFVKDDGSKCSKNKRGTQCVKMYKENNFYVAIRKNKLIAKFKVK